MGKTDDNNFDLTDAIGYLVGRASRVLGIMLNKRFSDYGYDITLDQWIVINASYNENGYAQQELVTITGRDKTAITRLIDDMEKKNLVVRVPDQLDKRTKRVYLTYKGKELHRELLPLVLRVNEEAEKGIDQEEMKICKKVLQTLYEKGHIKNDHK